MKFSTPLPAFESNVSDGDWLPCYRKFSISRPVCSHLDGLCLFPQFSWRFHWDPLCTACHFDVWCSWRPLHFAAWCSLNPHCWGKSTPGLNLTAFMLLGYLFSIWYRGFIISFHLFCILGGIKPLLFIPFCVSMFGCVCKCVVIRRLLNRT